MEKERTEEMKNEWMDKGREEGRKQDKETVILTL